MLKRLRSIEAGLTPKILAANVVIVASAFIWYFLAYNLLMDMADSISISANDTLPIVGAGTAGIALFAVAGSLLSKRMQKKPFLVSWMLGGVFLSLIPCYLSASREILIAVSAIFGSYFGLGMPTTMAFFASSTSPENRGRTGGITFLVIGLSFFILGLAGVGEKNLTSILLASIRLVTLFLLLFLKVNEEPHMEPGNSTYRGIIQNRTFLLYFVPWIMFNIVDYLTVSATNHMGSALGSGFDARMLIAIENGLIAVCAVVSGALVDTRGRKRLSIFGFAFLGMGYASLSLLQGDMAATGWFFYVISDGIAWGILNVVFLFTIWADITHGRDSEKIYVLGALPYLFSNFMYLLAAPIMISVADKVFTFASFFLFLAVLPLIFAPETLPEKVMKAVELKTYLVKAQEIAAKVQKKKED